MERDRDRWRKLIRTERERETDNWERQAEKWIEREKWTDTTRGGEGERERQMQTGVCVLKCIYCCVSLILD